MKRTIWYAITGVLLAILLQRSLAQINQMNRPATPAPAAPAKAQQTAPTTMKQPVTNNANTSTKTQVGPARIVQAAPLPRKINLLSRNTKLTLHTEKTLSAQIMMKSPVNTGSASATAQMQGQLRETGLLGINTKNYSNNHKVSYVLTSQTSGWLSNPTYNIKAAAPATDNTDPSWNCTTTIESVNAQSTSFMNASKNEMGTHLYPGAVYAFDDYASGNFRPFENGLNPMDIFTSTQVGTNSFTVQSPTAVTIQQAISNIIGQFSPNQGGAKIIQQTLYSDNQSDMAIAISAGGAYDGYSGSDAFSHTQSDHHIYVTLDAIKALYTISAHRPANGFFANGKMPQAPSALVMVQDVTYGARILANLDITISSKTDINKFQFAYNAIAANGFVNTDALAHDSSVTYKINAYMVGVPSSTGLITTLQDFQTQIDRAFSQSNYRNAVPIQYSLSDMDGNLLGVESMTDSFPVRSCTPAAEVFTLKSAFATIQTGSDGKNADSSFSLMLLGTNGAFVGIYSDPDDTEHKSNSTDTFQLSIGGDPKHPNPYTLADFSDGGCLDLTMEYGFKFGRTGDDWDISRVHLVLNFVSQKGTPLPEAMDINGFRMSSGNGGPNVADKKIYFGNDFKAMQ